jgi:hypothetical protein
MPPSPHLADSGQLCNTRLGYVLPRASTGDVKFRRTPIKNTDLLPQNIDTINNKFQTLWGKLLHGITIFKTLLLILA